MVVVPTCRHHHLPALDFRHLCYQGPLDVAAFDSRLFSVDGISQSGDLSLSSASDNLLTVGIRRPCLAKACDMGVGSSMPGNFFADITSNGGVKHSAKTGCVPVSVPIGCLFVCHTGLQSAHTPLLAASFLTASCPAYLPIETSRNRIVNVPSVRTLSGRIESSVSTRALQALLNAVLRSEHVPAYLKS